MRPLTSVVAKPDSSTRIGVGRRRQVGHRETTLGVGGGHTLGVGARVDDGDGRAGHRALGGVDDLANDSGRGRLLRPQSCREGQHGERAIVPSLRVIVPPDEISSHVSALVSPARIAVKNFPRDVTCLTLRNSDKLGRSTKRADNSVEIAHPSQLDQARSDASRCEIQNAKPTADYWVRCVSSRPKQYSVPS